MICLAVWKRNNEIMLSEAIKGVTSCTKSFKLWSSSPRNCPWKEVGKMICYESYKTQTLQNRRSKRPLLKAKKDKIFVTFQIIFILHTNIELLHPTISNAFCVFFSHLQRNSSLCLIYVLITVS